jgi:hypothetical protein
MVRTKIHILTAATRYIKYSLPNDAKWNHVGVSLKRMSIKKEGVGVQTSLFQYREHENKL